MKQVILSILIFVLYTGFASAAEKNIRCSDAIYGILHQSCVLSLEVQDQIMTFETCTIDDNYDVFHFYKNGTATTYDIRTCSFN